MSVLPESLVRFRTELEAAILREQAAHAPTRSSGRGIRLLRAVRRRPGRTLLALAPFAGAAAVALFASTPWQSSPGFLERAQAALTPPPGRILHMKWELIFTSEDPACTSTNTFEVWIDFTRPHTYRALMPDQPTPPPTPPRPDSGGLPCPPTTPPIEVGGALDNPDAVRFLPPNRFVRAPSLYFETQDRWARVRALISEGRAHREGQTQLDGRTVERVRFDPASCPAPAAGHCPIEPEYGYFDPETLHPVAWHYARDPMFPLVRNRERYLAYEYLPRTATNLALTDIRAQHPDATGP
jgi:hypothetical protein